MTENQATKSITPLTDSEATLEELTKGDQTAQSGAAPVDTKTAANLMAAFGGESMANRKYLYFAKIARKLGNEEVAKLFEETANHETAHAFAHLELIYPSAEMTVEKILALAAAGEMYESVTMYPNFEAEAIEEGNQAAVAEFQEQAKESLEHAGIFQKAAKRFGALKRVEAYHASRYQAALDKLKTVKV
jgi:rubrerythrin